MFEKNLFRRLFLGTLPRKRKLWAIRTRFPIPEDPGIFPTSEAPQKQINSHPEAEIRPVEDSRDGQEIQDDQHAQQQTPRLHPLEGNNHPHDSGWEHQQPIKA